MKFKKILSASALSLTLIASLVSSVFAAEAIAYGGNTSDKVWSFSLNGFGGN